MAFNPSRKALLERIRQLEETAQKKERYEQINQVLFRIANAVNTTKDLPELYSSIHMALSRILDTTNFFIALYTSETDSAQFPYCVDEVDGQLPPVQGISRTASLTAEVIRSGKPLLLNMDEIIAFRKKCGFPIPNCTPSAIWLGAPLKNEGSIIGVIAVQSYKDTFLYDETDRDVMVAVADQIALAIERKRAEENQKKLIQKLHAALEEVRTLQGILPICSRCKKIRDDKGYWNQIETYIQNHSKAMFSHGLCPACSDDLYSKEDWYEDFKKTFKDTDSLPPENPE